MNAMTACPRCNGALAPGAQFCGACGSPVGAGPATAPQPPPQYAPPQPPQMPPMANMAHMARGFSGGGGGNSRQVNVAGAPVEAFNTAMRVIEGAGAEVHWRQPPQGARFVLTRKSLWSTLGMPIKYDGEVQIGPSGQGQNVARLSLKLRWGSAAGLMLSQVAVIFFGSMVNIYLAYYLFFFLALSLGISAWTLASRVPEQALKELGDQIGAGAPGYAQPAQAAPAYAPQAQSAPQAPPVHGAPPIQAPPAAPAPQPAGPAGDEAAKIMEQIKQLGALRDAGILSSQEFEAKKAEFLARL